ncbi:MAG: hypothetical protein ACI94Y_003730 [Maribacter sp.]|jgi:hypothetical protein
MTTQKIMLSGLKVVVGIHVFRILISILVLGLVGFVMSNTFEDGTFWIGVKQAFIDKLGLNEEDNVASTIGYLFGTMLIPFILMVLQIILIK